MFFVLDLEYLLKETIEFVWVGRGSTASEGGVSLHHGGGGKGVATQLNCLAESVAPELMFIRIESESGGALGELERERA